MTTIFDAVAYQVKTKPPKSPQLSYEQELQQAEKSKQCGDSIIITDIASNPIVQELLHKQHLQDTTKYQKTLDEKQRQIELLQTRNHKLETRLNTVIGYTSTRNDKQVYSSDAPQSSQGGIRRSSVLQSIQHYYIDVETEQERYKLLLKQLSVQTYVTQWKTRKTLANILQSMLHIIKLLHKYCTDLRINDKLLNSELNIQQCDADTFLHNVAQGERINNNLHINWYKTHILDAVPVITVSIESIVAHKQQIDTLVDCFADRNLQLTHEHKNAIECADETIQRYDTLLQQHEELNHTYQSVYTQYRTQQHTVQQSNEQIQKLQQQVKYWKQQFDAMQSKHREQANTILQLQRKLKLHAKHDSSENEQYSIPQLRSRPQSAATHKSMHKSYSAHNSLYDLQESKINDTEYENRQIHNNYNTTELYKLYTDQSNVPKRPQSAAVHSTQRNDTHHHTTIQSPIKPNSRPSTASTRPSTSHKRPVSSRSTRTLAALTAGIPSTVAHIDINSTLHNNTNSRPSTAHVTTTVKPLTHLEQKQASIVAIKKVLNIYPRKI